MITGKLTITIDKIKEQDFMEHCLNLYFSGYDPMALMMLYGLGKRWGVSKIIFLRKLMGEMK